MKFSLSMVAGSRINCTFCRNFAPHPYWCYILTDRRCNNNKSRQQILAKIGFSRHPIHKVNCENRKPGYKTGSKSTKAGAGHYQVEFIVGPFYRGRAEQFINKWAPTRKTVPRLIKGLQLARRYQYVVWGRDADWLRNFARKHLTRRKVR